jgi:uncharacterized protein (TIGR00297 family)
LSVFLQPNILFINFITGLTLASIISLISYRFKLLSASGIISTFLLALIIYTFGTWQWTIPIVTFFLFSSLLSRIRKRRNVSVEKHFDKTDQRDYLQVLANGGLASILVLFYYFNPLELLYIVYVSMIAAVCADTWATEIGTLYNTKTINILSLKKVEQGISGGISLPGTIGAFAGSFVIALTSLPWIESNITAVLFIIVISGFSGNIIDSILGASLQAQSKCIICSSITERKIHCGKQTELVKGLRWINNDAVNFGTGISGGIFSLILLDMVKA